MDTGHNHYSDPSDIRSFRFDSIGFYGYLIVVQCGIMKNVLKTWTKFEIILID